MTLAQAEVIELKLGNTTPASGNQSISANEFARRVNEQMAGKVHVTVFDNSQLGNEREMLQKLKIGTLDFSQPSTIMSTIAPEFGLFDMPYLIKDRAHFDFFSLRRRPKPRAIRSSPFMKMAFVTSPTTSVRSSRPRI